MFKFIIFLPYLFCSNLFASSFYNANGILPHFEMFSVKKYQIASYQYKANNPHLIVTVHGLFENCSYLNEIHQRLLSNGFDVLCLELPGHGKSSGTPLEVGHFDDYALLIDNKFLENKLRDYQKSTFIAHSTGTLVYLNFIRTSNKALFDQTILVAPLIKTKHWFLAKLLLTIVSPFTDSISRGSSKNKQLIAYKKQDSNIINAVSVDWFEKLIAWNKKLELDTYKAEKEITLILAGNDEVVDNQATKEYYGQHFQKINIIEINNAEHRVHIDPTYKELFYKKLFKLLK